MLAVLLLIWFILCWCAWKLKLRLCLAGGAMIVSGCIAIAADVLPMVLTTQADLPDFVRQYWEPGTDERLAYLATCMPAEVDG